MLTVQLLGTGIPLPLSWQCSGDCHLRAHGSDAAWHHSPALCPSGESCPLSQVHHSPHPSLSAPAPSWLLACVNLILSLTLLLAGGAGPAVRSGTGLLCCVPQIADYTALNPATPLGTQHWV